MTPTATETAFNITAVKYLAALETLEAFDYARAASRRSGSRRPWARPWPVSGYPDFRVSLPSKPLEHLEAKGIYFDYYSHVYRALYDGHRRNLRNVGGGWVTCFPLTGVTSPQEAKIYAVYFDPPAGGGSRAGGGDEDEAAALSVSMTAGDLLAKGDQFATAGAYGDAWYAYLLSALVSTHYVLGHGGVRVLLSAGKLRVSSAEVDGGTFILRKDSGTVAWLRTLLRA